MIIFKKKFDLRLFPKGILKSISGTFVLRIINAFFSFITAILLARILGAKGYGFYAYSLTIVGLFSSPFATGLLQLLTRTTAIYQTNKSYSLMHGLMIRSSQLAIILPLALILLAYAIGKLYPQNISALNLSTFTLALPLIFFACLIADLQGFLRGLKKIVWSQVPENIIRPAFFILALILANTALKEKLDANQVMLLQLCAAIAGFLACLLIFFRNLPINIGKEKATFETRRWIGEYIPFILIGSLQIINNRADIIVLGFFKDATSVGNYRVATRLADFLSFVLMAFYTTLGPSIVEMYQEKRLDELKKMMSNSARVVTVLVTGAFLFLLLWGKGILIYVFGADFSFSYHPLMILAFGQIINAACGLVGLMLNMAGFERITVITLGITALLNICLNIILVPLYGINGAAIANVISMATWNIVLLGMVRKRIGINISLIG